MTLLTNSMRPQHKSTNVAGPAYSAYKLRGICSRCSSSSYQTVNSGHPIFKMVCPVCKAYLTELKLRKQLDKNSSVTEPKTP